LPHAFAESSAEADQRMTRLAQYLADTADQPASDSLSLNGATVSSPSRTSNQSNSETSTPIAPADGVGTPLLKPGTRIDGGAAERPGGVSWFLQTITALGIVIGLALAVRYLYTRMGGHVARHSSPVVEVLSRTNVAPRSHVMLMRVGGRVLVVSDSSAGMRTLASIDDPQEVADLLGAVSAAKPTSLSKGFSQLLHKFNDEHDSDPGDPIEPAVIDAEPQGRVRDSVSGLLSRVRSMGREGGPS